MTKRINALDGMTMKDMLSDDGLIIEVGGDDEEPIHESYPYNPAANLNHTEMLKLLNMGEFGEDDGEEKIDSAEAMMPWSMSFDKIKAKSQNLTNDGKITKLIKREGVGEVLPGDCLAIVHYGAYIEYQDEPFDSTFQRGAPERLRLNQGEIIEGLEFGFLTMKKHEIACFVIAPEYAYREAGSPPLIPPNSEILFIVQVVDFIDGGAAETLENLSKEERAKFKNVKIRADVLMKTAAESFKRYKTRQAIREYTNATKMLESAKLEDDEEEAVMKKMLSKAYGNLAVCFNKEDRPRQACIASSSVPNKTAKTYFHHGRALLKMGEYKRALEELQLSLKLEPTNPTTIKEIQLANTLQRKYVESEKRLWKNCLKARETGEAVNEYAEIAREFCESFANNESILRQPLPEGLTPMEDQCMREQAAKLNLTVIQQVRYGKETSYLAKPKY